MLPPADMLAKVLHKGETASDSGSLLIGDKGILFSPNDYGAKFRLTPEKDFAGVQTERPEKAAGRRDGENKDDDPHHEEGVGRGDPGREAGDGVIRTSTSPAG